MIYEEDRIETKENTQVKNNISAKTENIGRKHSYQTNEKKESCSNNKGKGNDHIEKWTKI